MPIRKPYAIYVPPLTLGDVFKHLLIWTVICCVAAAPSFYVAASLNDGWGHLAGILAGIALFIVGYTVISCHPHARRLRRQPFVMPTLCVGYGFRLLVSLLFPLGLFIDMMVGMVIGVFLETTMPYMSIDQTGFLVAFTWTVMQGIALNVMIFFLMLLTYNFQLMSRTMPPPPSANLCQDCGYDLRASERQCPECGCPIPQGYGRAMSDNFAHASATP